MQGFQYATWVEGAMFCHPVSDTGVKSRDHNGFVKLLYIVQHRISECKCLPQINDKMKYYLGIVVKNVCNETVSKCEAA